jgi:hypothetical protein
MRIPDELLEARVDVEPRLEVPQPDGDLYGALQADVHAIVVDRSKLVIDERVDAETHGAEVLAETHVLVQPENFITPGSRVTVHKGTPRERTLQCVATAYARHSTAPESAQAWLK